MPDQHIKLLAEALSRLGDIARRSSARQHLARRTSSINAELKRAVLAEIPAFSASANPDILPELADHIAQHSRELLRLLGGGALGSFGFVREHAQRRAEQHFPLEATLHAYRCGHRVFSRWLRDWALAAIAPGPAAPQAVAAVADFAIEYTDAISTIAAGAYSTRTRLLADVAGDQRAQLLGILLDGYDEADSRVAGILRGAGYLDQRQSFCVALAQSTDPIEMSNPARARRLVAAIDSELQKQGWRRIIDLRQNKVTMVFADSRRASGWTAPQSSLARRVKNVLSSIGNSVLIGVSNDAPSTSHVPQACREAGLALELAGAAHRVLPFSEIPAQRLMLHLAGEEFRRVLPPWADSLCAADQVMQGALVATLRAYADADMNVLKAAQRLSVHPNTVYSRLQKIYDVSGQRAQSFHALTELLIVAACRSR